MKMAINMFVVFRSRIEGQKLGPFLVTKYTKNQSLFNEKKSEGLGLFLTHKND